MSAPPPSGSLLSAAQWARAESLQDARDDVYGTQVLTSRELVRLRAEVARLDALAATACDERRAAQTERDAALRQAEALHALVESMRQGRPL